MQKLIFVHIPKTGGKSVQSYLSEIYKKKLRGDKKENSNMWSSIFGLGPVIYKYNYDLINNVSCIIGHFPVDKYIHLKSKGWKFVTWIRDPVNRIASCYDFFRYRLDNTKQRRKMHPTLRDNVIHLDIVEFSNTITGAYKIFLNDLDQLDFVGFTEYFTEDLKRFEDFLNVKFSKNLHMKNVTKGPRTVITDDMLKQMRKNQWEDYEIYNQLKELRYVDTK